jgi:hypothetical protein
MLKAGAYLFSCLQWQLLDMSPRIFGADLPPPKEHYTRMASWDFC